MSVEYTIDIDKDISSYLEKKKGKRVKAYSYNMVEDLSKDATRAVINGKALDEVQKVLTKSFINYADDTKDALKVKIASSSGVEYVGTNTSFNGTYNQTIAKSYNQTAKLIRKKVANQFVENKKLLNYLGEEDYDALRRLGINGATKKELQAVINKRIARDIVDAIGGTTRNQESLVIQTEARGMHYNNFKKNSLITMNPVKWNTAQDERTCPICAPRDQVVYKNINEAPSYPAHPRCRCDLEEQTKKEYAKFVQTQ